MGKVVAIDGPSGSGKSTVARMLADMLGFNYLDTGALYRAVALGLTRAGITPEDTDGKIEAALGVIDVSFCDGLVFLDGEDVSDPIRTPETGHFSSVFSARRPVREFLLPVQARAAETGDLVAEGRDMTTVVFPEAWVKFFLKASAGARAKRRYDQLRKAGVPISMEEAEKDVTGRDRRDSTRAMSPLRVAADAVVIDSSDMNVSDVMKTVMGALRAAGYKR